MATKEFWVGSVGALLYDDGETYPDTVSRVALRGAQVYLEEAPTEDEHVLRKLDMPSFSSDTAEQGDIWYFNGTIWTLLHHGTAGQVLKTGGHGANPSWNDEALNDLSDVVISSPVASDMFYFNGINWVHRAQDGWILDADTYVYVSATSFKVEGKDVTARFPVGCKIKLTQTTVKYFYVISTAFSTDTTVTITGGSDYSLANAAITSPYYSYQSCPQGFPQWLNYTETWTGFSSAPSGGVCRFKISGRLATMMLSRTTSGTSNDTVCTVTLPVSASSLTNHFQHCYGVSQDSGTWDANPSRAMINPSSPTIATLYRQVVTAWTGSGNKNWAGTIQWEI